MHPLNDVTAGVKHSTDVLCVHGSSEVRVAVVTAIMVAVTDALKAIQPAKTGGQESTLSLGMMVGKSHLPGRGPGRSTWT